ncbi:MAG TPA: NAD(P)-dependent alcohol dehydrogenase [Polyangiaceae bacterium]
MRTAVLRDAFGVAHLMLESREVPKPGPGEALVRIDAVALNHRDWMVVSGRYNPRQSLPLVPGSDAAGRVVALGDGVTRVRVGDRVCPAFAQKWLSGPPTRAALKTTLGSPLDGVLSRYVVFHEDGLVHPPERFSDLEAACLPCAAVTAWNALVTHGAIERGQTVLLLGTGGVSIFALQLAKSLGARVLITSKSNHKLERARALGADETLNYTLAETLDVWARRVTGGDGVDLVVDVVGGENLAPCIRAARPGGRVAMIGVLAGDSVELDLRPVIMRQIRLQGMIVGSRASFEAMNAHLETSTLVPVMDRVYRFEEFQAAFLDCARGEHFGKICIQLED